MKMFFTFVLASVLVVSTVFGRAASSPRPQLMIEDEHLKFKKDETSVTKGIVADDRTSNLNYVIAIQHSTLWAEIKRRSVTIKTNLQLNDIDDRSLEKLSDKELAQLKQAHNDGLKCVAVDQLLILQTITLPTKDGKMSIRRAITKITKVLTEFTTKYYKDTSYQYEEIKETDDDAQVFRCLTIIVEDNKELCQIGVGSPTKPDTKNDVKEGIPLENYGKVKNGTTSSSDINNVTSDRNTIKGSSQSPETPENGNSDQSLYTTAGPKNGDTKHSSTSEGNQNNAAQHDGIQDYNTYNGNAVNTSTEKADIDVNRGGFTNTNMGDSTDADASTNTDVSTNTGISSNDVASETSSSDIKNVRKNNVSPGNGQDSDNGTNDTDNDITSVGLLNNNSVRKGYADDGNVNNGNMKLYNLNKGANNKGVLNNVMAVNGIINVGTLNNGPINYSSVIEDTNNGTQELLNSYDARKFLMSIDNMYSTIIKEFGEK